MKMLLTTIAASMLAVSASTGFAQQDAQRPTSPQRDDAATQSRQSQIDRSQTADSAAAQHQLSDYFLGKLMLHNQCTIQLSELARQRASSDEVKQFAAMVAQEHSQLDERLRQQAPQIAAIAMAQSGDQRYSAGFRGTDQGEGRQDAARDDLRRGDQATQRQRERQTQGFNRSLGAQSAQSQSGLIPQILMVERQATDNYVQMTTQMLERYQGQDFDMGFLGYQIGGHTWALAELQAASSIGDQQFQQIVSDTTAKLQQHLETAKQLSQKLEDDRQASANNPGRDSATRSGTSQR